MHVAYTCRNIEGAFFDSVFVNHTTLSLCTPLLLFLLTGKDNYQGKSACLG